MAYLNWISDNALMSAVNHLIGKAEQAKVKAKEEFGKNVIDPFSAMFEIAGFEIDYLDWIKNETNRQAQKTLQNHIGEFHQSILGSLKDWEDLKIGNVIDLASKKHRVIAEIKNKYNTISGGKLSDLYYSLETQVMQKNSKYNGYVAYYVAIIPKTPKPYNLPFTPSNKDLGIKCPLNERIREIDGSSFYSLATGTEHALEELFNVLPNVITECSGGKYLIKEPNRLKEYFKAAFHI